MYLQQTIHDIFSSIAARSPDCVALQSDGVQMTYGALERRSDQMARFLRARGAAPGQRVGLYAHRSVDAIAAILGILKAGAAYVPFDPTYPAQQLNFVYQDCAPCMMLMQPSLLKAHGATPFWSGPAEDIKAAFDNGAAVAAAPAPVQVSRDDPAYVMYTSGSTGHPKGVSVPHRGVVRLVIDNPYAEMNADQVHLQLAPLAFDASTFEIWGALLHGAKLAVLPAPYPSLDDVADAIARHGVTTLWLTAGLFHLMVDHRLDGLKPLRQLLAGGDVLSPPHIAKALLALPQCQLINGYGPTENTTFTCCYRIPRDACGGAPIPIGKPIAHTQVHILDDWGKPVADGQEGELYAGGDGVALGYLNRPELTDERFVADPFTSGGARLMYRTGDRARRRPDGNVEFLGRVDRQVKINGKRVELDEIEACLRRSNLVQDAAVTSYIPEGGARKLLAYVSPQAEKPFSLHDLKLFLKAALPDYMVPVSITVLEALPLSPTGKVDRAKLPLPAAPRDVTSAGPPPVPGNPVEAELIAIWRKVLKSDEFGFDDNFFDLGGTSLQLLQVHATIVSDMKQDVTVVDLFQYPRISALAAYLRQRSHSSPADWNMLTVEDRARRQTAALARARTNLRKNGR